MIEVYLLGVAIAWPLFARECYREQNVKDDCTVALSALGGFILAWTWPVIVCGIIAYWTPTAIRHTILRGIK